MRHHNHDGSAAKEQISWAKMLRKKSQYKGDQICKKNALGAFLAHLIKFHTLYVQLGLLSSSFWTKLNPLDTKPKKALVLSCNFDILMR